eukprot:TRINITY_DN865_c1_g1_i4.p1 TRINITY_DN865_c1_g1~~TRINITY_DN865_c1_g1_i4.p1  ORF type:complete len:112 (-),score=15.90 TRINITY_DN865_c1_g1_i4:110-445(-)
MKHSSDKIHISLCHQAPQPLSCRERKVSRPSSDQAIQQELSSFVNQVHHCIRSSSIHKVGVPVKPKCGQRVLRKPRSELSSSDRIKAMGFCKTVSSPKEDSPSFVKRISFC